MTRVMIQRGSVDRGECAGGEGSYCLGNQSGPREREDGRGAREKTQKGVGSKACWVLGGTGCMGSGAAESEPIEWPRWWGVMRTWFSGSWGQSPASSMNARDTGRRLPTFFMHFLLSPRVFPKHARAQVKPVPAPDSHGFVCSRASRVCTPCHGSRVPFLVGHGCASRGEGGGEGLRYASIATFRPIDCYSECRCMCRWDPSQIHSLPGKSARAPRSLGAGFIQQNALCKLSPLADRSCVHTPTGRSRFGSSDRSSGAWGEGGYGVWSGARVPCASLLDVMLLFSNNC